MRKVAYILTVSLLIVLLTVGNVSAHAADMYFHTHTVTLAPDGIHITWDVVPGPMLAHIIWQRVDADADEAISDAEVAAWTDAALAYFGADFDGASLPLTLTGIEWPSDIPQLFSGEEPIRMYLTAEWTTTEAQTHTLAIHNTYDPANSMAWFDLKAEPGIALHTPAQDAGALHVAFRRVAVAEEAEALTTWESGQPDVPWEIEALGLDALAPDGDDKAAANTATLLESLVRKQVASPIFVLAALGVAAVLGAFHALSPGHGKTIVAAYLVGAQGKVYHAIILGALVTTTHTGTVFALGILTLTAARYLVNVDIFPLLEVTSGVLILVLGIGLLIPRLRAWFKQWQRERQRQNAPPVVVRDAASGKTRVSINQPIEEIGPAHTHAPGTIPRAPVQGNPLVQITWRSLVTLGISGGLVPCPDAIAILLVTVTINRLAFGLSLIVAFSAGLAAVLILVGVLIVQGKRLFARLRWFDRIATTVPVLSAMVVLLLGGWLTANAAGTLSGGWSLAQIRREEAPFDKRAARILYVALDEDDRYQLFVTGPLGDRTAVDVTQITDEQNSVWHYTLSPDYKTVIYVTTIDLDSQLWQWTPATGEKTLLLACPDAFCSDVAWFPEGQRILYNRLALETETATLGYGSLWWLDLQTGETAPLFQDMSLPGYNARWSPDGTRVSYTGVNPQSTHIYDMATNERQTIPSEAGYPAVWSPDSDALLLVDLDTVGDVNFYQLYHYDLAEQQLRPVDITTTFDHDYPAWSPDGAWIAVVRTQWRTDAPQQGSQIWLVRPDGSEAQRITENANAYHNQPVWSPDSRYLLYSVRSQALNAVSVLHIFDVQSGDVQMMSIHGTRPTWLPPGGE